MGFYKSLVLSSPHERRVFLLRMPEPNRPLPKDELHEVQQLAGKRPGQTLESCDLEVVQDLDDLAKRLKKINRGR